MAYDRQVIALQPQIAGDPAAAQLRPRPDVVRRGLPPLALAVAVVAAVTDPGRWYETVVLAVPVVAFALWERAGGSPTVALTVGVLVPATVAQLSGGLEPAMFLVSLLVVAVAGWEGSSWRAGVCCLAAAATPPLCATLSRPTIGSRGASGSSASRSRH